MGCATVFQYRGDPVGQQLGVDGAGEAPVVGEHDEVAGVQLEAGSELVDEPVIGVDLGEPGELS